MSALSRFIGLPRHLNPRLIPIAGRMPPLAVLRHRGRISGRQFDTAVQAYRTETGSIVGLAYDTNANWALNILAAGQAQISRGGRNYVITDPHRRRPEVRAELPMGSGR
jgi:hypothetical protein